MKIILFILFAFTLQAQTWYVDKNVARGVTNLIVNGTFDDSTAWAFDEFTGTISGGKCNFEVIDGQTSRIKQTILTVGKSYVVKLDVDGLIEDSVWYGGWSGIVNMFGNAGRGSYNITRNGYHEFTLTATQTTLQFNIIDSYNDSTTFRSDYTATMDNIEVYEITGDHDGTSWANAVWSLPLLYWENVEGSDTVYISGSTDSVIYYAPTIIHKDSTFKANYKYSSEVVITPSWETGKNGDVYFFNADTLIETNFSIAYLSNVKFVNLHFWTICPVDWSYLVDPPGAGAYVRGGETNFIAQFDSSNTYEDCHFLNAMTGSAWFVGTNEKTTVKNSIIETLTNNSAKSQDTPTFGWGGLGGHKFIGNTMIQRNIFNGLNEFDPHADMIQVGGRYGEGGYEETQFINNFILNLTPTKMSDYNGGFYTEDNGQKQRYVFINNIFVMDMPDTNYLGNANSITAIWMRGSSGGDPANYSLRMFNNTIIYPSHNITAKETDTLILRNNFFIVTGYQIDEANRSWVVLLLGAQIDYLSSDYNHWYSPNWSDDTRFYADNESYPTFSQWRALQGTDPKFVNMDNNSDSGYVYLVDVRDSVISAYMTPEAQRGTGENLSYLASTYPEIMFDILGNPRDTANWDIGALQFSNEAPPAEASAILRGSDGRLMIQPNGRKIYLR